MVTIRDERRLHQGMPASLTTCPGFSQASIVTTDLLSFRPYSLFVVLIVLVLLVRVILTPWRSSP